MRRGPGVAWPGVHVRARREGGKGEGEGKGGEEEERGNKSQPLMYMQD